MSLPDYLSWAWSCDRGPTGVPKERTLPLHLKVQVVNRHPQHLQQPQPVPARATGRRRVQEPAASAHYILMTPGCGRYGWGLGFSIWTTRSLMAKAVKRLPRGL